MCAKCFVYEMRKSKHSEIQFGSVGVFRKVVGLAFTFYLKYCSASHTILYHLSKPREIGREKSRKNNGKWEKVKSKMQNFAISHNYQRNTMEFEWVA